MANQDQVAKILELVNSLIATPIDKLVSNPKWGSINFEVARSDLEMLFGLCGHLKVLPLEILPSSVADEFVASITQAGTVIKQIESFSIESSSPPAQRDQLVNQTHAYAEHLLTTTQSWIPFLAYQKGDVQKNIDALSQAVSNANSILEVAKRESAEKSKEVADIVTVAREASASAGVGVFTSDFAGEASDLEIAAQKWLIATGVLAAVTIVAALVPIFFPLDKDSTNVQIVQYMTSKLVILAVFLTTTVWCGRIYKATKHQAATNSHRANALKTFQAFVKAASDDPTRDAVLLETTRSIFAIAPSGYLQTMDTPSDSGTKVLEIIKSAAGSGK